jgi:hypothetical protein
MMVARTNGSCKSLTSKTNQQYLTNGVGAGNGDQAYR